MLRKKKYYETDAGKNLSSKKQRKLTPKEALGLPERKDEEDTLLESKVFGGGNQLLDTFLHERLPPYQTKVFICSSFSSLFHVMSWNF